MNVAQSLLPEINHQDWSTALQWLKELAFSDPVDKKKIIYEFLF